MLGELPADVIGTAPKYPSIVDHSWLAVDTASYDNYPSDNNSVRIVPKLHDLWDHSPAQTGINLIPNATVKPLGVRSSEEDARQVTQVIREAKKAVMSGLKGKALSQYLRARFSSKHLEQAAEGLKKVAEEIGLLGNVYIDASAFNSYQEAEKFLSQHRTRLAQDILLNSESMGPHVVSMLASTFHKNVVNEIEYNDKLFSKYKNHLISTGRIASDIVIDSKESLRKAFLAEKLAVPSVSVTIPESVLTEKEINKGLDRMAADRSFEDAELVDSLNLSKITPIASFIQQNISKGKTASAVKEMLRSKFLLGDIKVASEAIAVILSKEGLSEENINGMIKEGKISLTLGNELKKIGKKFPIKKAAVIAEGIKAPVQIGASGHLYTPTGKKNDSPYVKASVEALKKGIEIGRIRSKLLQKLSSTEAGSVLEEAMVQFNAGPAGSMANQAVKPKKALYPELAPKQALPDPSTIIPQTQEILGFFEGSQMDVSMNAPFNREKVEVNELQNIGEGISGIL
jgi:hypothetical protein